MVISTIKFAVLIYTRRNRNYKRIKSSFALELESYDLFTGLTEKDQMDNLGYVFQVICVGLAITTFLLNTGRGVKAIEVCQECLIFLNNEVLKKKGGKIC